MATVKNIPDTYDIYVPTMTVHGNLNIVGNTTTINSATVNADDLLMFNTNSAVNYNASIGVYRPTASNVYIRWNESITGWQITNDGTNYGNIVYAPNGNVTLAANIYLQTTAVAPPAIAGYSALFAGTVGNGGSGIHVTNTVYADKELILKQRSIAYSILFG